VFPTWNLLSFFRSGSVSLPLWRKRTINARWLKCSFFPSTYKESFASFSPFSSSKTRTFCCEGSTPHDDPIFPLPWNRIAVLFFSPRLGGRSVEQRVGSDPPFPSSQTEQIVFPFFFLFLELWLAANGKSLLCTILTGVPLCVCLGVESRSLPSPLYKGGSLQCRPNSSPFFFCMHGRVEEKSPLLFFSFPME